MLQLDLSLHKCLILHIGNDDEKNSSLCQLYNSSKVKSFPEPQGP